jgi:amicyanin
VVTVEITGLKFVPDTIEVPAGTTVEWVNRDSVDHTVTQDVPEAERMFDSDSIVRGQTFRFTFATPGTYEYFCIPHPFMKGTVVVT